MNATSELLTDSTPSVDDLVTSDVVRRYVKRELGAAEEADFEQQLIASDSLQLAVEAELLMRDHLKAATGNDESDPLTTSVSRPVWTHVWSLAASMFVGLTGGYLISDRLEPRGFEGSPASLVLFSEQRGGNKAPLYRADAGLPITARFLTASDEPHRLSVAGMNGEKILAVEDLLPDASGFVIVNLGEFDSVQSPLTLTLESSGRSDSFQLTLE